MVTARFGHRDRFAASRHTGGINLLGAVTISQVLRRFGWVRSIGFAHGLTTEFETMRAVQKSVEDGVGHGGFPDIVMPVLDGQLAGCLLYTSPSPRDRG